MRSARELQFYEALFPPARPTGEEHQEPETSGGGKSRRRTHAAYPSADGTDVVSRQKNGVDAHAEPREEDVEGLMAFVPLFRE